MVDPGFVIMGGFRMGHHGLVELDNHGDIQGGLSSADPGCVRLPFYLLSSIILNFLQLALCGSLFGILGGTF